MSELGRDWRDGKSEVLRHLGWVPFSVRLLLLGPTTSPPFLCPVENAPKETLIRSTAQFRWLSLCFGPTPRPEVQLRARHLLLSPLPRHSREGLQTQALGDGRGV